MIQEANLQWRYEDTETGLVMPWYTLPTLQWLKKQETRKWKVFEYGCGYSTIWWRVNSEQLYSIDSDPVWAYAMGAEFLPDENAYVSAIHSVWANRFFDCVIVDGLHRERCALTGYQLVAENGFMIIDNWEETGGFDCSRIKTMLKDWKLTVHQQPNHSDWRTAVFQRP